MPVSRQVLVVTHGLSLGGAETILVKLLNSFDREKVSPILVSLADGVLRPRINEDIPVRILPRRHRFDMKPATDIAVLLNRTGITTVLGLGFFAAYFVKRALPTVRHGVRLFIWTHTTKPRTLKEFLQMSVYARGVTHSDRIIALCMAQADYISKLYRLPRNQFEIIYNGVDAAWWGNSPPEFDRESFKASQGLFLDMPVIVCVAMFRPEKRHTHIIRALEVLHRTTAYRAHLLFVGDGPTEKEARSLVRTLGLGTWVRFCGRQSDVRPYYWASDVATLASNSETFPMTILEGMAAGLPCVVTDVGGAREIITTDYVGEVVKVNDVSGLARAWAHFIERKSSLDQNTIRQFVAERFPVASFVRRFEETLACPEDATP